MDMTFGRRMLAAMAVGLTTAPLPAQQPLASADKPTLIVLLAIDQMRADYFERFDRQLTRGLGRLYRGGAVFTNAWQDHAITKTEPGHAAMLSGRFPRSTGILAGDLSIADTNVLPLEGSARGISPRQFRGTTLVDWLRAADPQSRTLSISRKDDAAMLMVGRAKETVIWYSTAGTFTTSTYYADTIPTWLKQFNARRLPQSFAGKSWSLLRPPREYPEPDDVRLEAGGRDYIFPHDYPPDSAGAAAYLIGYPQMDSVTAQLALDGVRATRLGAGPSTDLLAISFSATDAVGHRFGPDSRELHDHILRLDRYLGEFIDSLYKLRDSSRILFALTSDHGIQSYPELRAQRERRQFGRVDLYPVIASVEKRLQSRGIGKFDYEFADGAFTIAREPLRRAGINADSLIGGMAASLRRVRGVQRVDLVSALGAMDTTRDDIARRWFHMIPPDWPVDFVITMQPGWYYAFVSNAYHGTAHPDDARVPLLFYGAGVLPGRHATFVRVVDIAPTLAAAARVQPAERLDGVVLSAALKNP